MGCEGFIVHRKRVKESWKLNQKLQSISGTRNKEGIKIKVKVLGASMAQCPKLSKLSEKGIVCYNSLAHLFNTGTPAATASSPNW